jgi:hypothetical protein
MVGWPSIMAHLLHDDGNGLEQWSPLRVVQCVYAGAILVASQFFWIALHEGMIRLHYLYFGPRLGLLGMAASILLLFAPILIGIVLIALGSWVLSDGLVRLKWSEAHIERARLWAESHELNRTVLWLLSGFCACEFVASYLIFSVWKVAHHATIRLFFDSLALLCIPSLVVSSVCDRLREEAPHATLRKGKISSL